MLYRNYNFEAKKHKGCVIIEINTVCSVSKYIRGLHQNR